MKKLMAVSLLLGSVPALASGWRVSAAYNNPVGADLGVNVMHLWSNFAFEVGVGHIGGGKGNGGVSGDLDFKYLFGSSGWRPYLEAGLGYGLSGGDDGVSFGAGGPFGGGGFYYDGSKWVFNVGVDYMINSENMVFPVVGIGLKI